MVGAVARICPQSWKRDVKIGISTVMIFMAIVRTNFSYRTDYGDHVLPAVETSLFSA